VLIQSNYTQQRRANLTSGAYTDNRTGVIVAPMRRVGGLRYSIEFR